MVGHGAGLFRLFLHAPDKGLWACLGDLNPRYIQTVGDLGSAIQNTAPLSSGLIVPGVVIAEGNSIHPM